MIIREEIAKALVERGEDITTKPVRIRRDTGSYVVFVDDEFYGIWDKLGKRFLT